MERHAVPENIMDVEFKLFGSLTAKQFGYILGGGLLGLLSYYIFKSLGSTFLGWIFGGIGVILGLSLALIRINEQPFEIWLGNFLNAMFSSQKRVWKKEKKSKKNMNTVQTPQAQQIVRGRRNNTQLGQSSNSTQNNVQSRPNLQNRKNSMNKQQVNKPLPKVNSNQYGYNDVNDPKAENNQQQMQNNNSKQSSSDFSQNRQAKTSTEEAMNIDNNKSNNNITGQKKMLNDSNTQTQENNKDPIAGQPAKPNTFAVPGSAQKGVSMMNNQDTNPPGSTQQRNLESKSTQTSQSIPNTLNRGTNTNMTNNTGQASSDNQTQGNSGAGGSVSALRRDNVQPNSSSTSDTAANDLNQIDPAFKANQTVQKTYQNNSQGQVNVNQQQTSVNAQGQNMQKDQTSSQRNIDNKAKVHSDVLPSKNEVIQNQQSRDAQNISNLNQSKPSEDTENYNIDQTKQLRGKIADYSNRNQKLQKKLEEINTQLQQIKSQYQKVSQNNEELKQKLINQKEQKSQTLPDPPTLPQQPKSPSSQSDKVMTPKVYNGPYLTKKANVISGIVKSRNGDLLPGVVVIVKNEKNRPVRAMKTNSLGQFITTTSLNNGTYLIELSKNDYSFGRYEIKLDGNILPTYEFVAN